MILVVVCHPDDEVIWFGGSIHALCNLANVEVDVICLSGKDEGSPREQEFHAAQQVAGYQKGIVLGYPLRRALESLPDISTTLEQGLAALGRRLDEVELLITHSPFGDEHLHPHHQQAFKELLNWSWKVRVPMGFFTTVPLPLGKARSLLRNYRRMGALHLTSLAKCSYSLGDYLKKWLFYGNGWFPKYYVQWQIDNDVKLAMLNCYQSIDLEQHRDGYATYTSSIESFYLYDRQGFEVISRVLEKMDVPGAKDLFGKQLRLRLVASRLLRKIKNALHS